jgi:hypothetical protein
MDAELRDVKIVVPSGGRPHRLWDYSLGWLERVGLLDQVVLVVAPAELAAYEAASRGVPVVAGAAGLNGNRRFVASMFPDGTKVLSVDDDLRDVKVSTRGDLVTATPPEVAAMIGRGFAALGKFRGGLWGISPNHDRRHADDPTGIRVGLPPVEGCIFGFISGRTVEPDPRTMFDDIERAAATFRAGWNVVQLNRFSHFQSASVDGGRLDRARLNGACADVRRIERAYPDLVEHKFGTLAGQYPCRAAVRPKRSVSDPVTPAELAALRRRLATEKPRVVPAKLHRYAVRVPNRPTAGPEGRIERAIVELRIALDRHRSYGRGDTVIDGLRALLQRHYTEGKPVTQLVDDRQRQLPLAVSCVTALSAVRRWRTAPAATRRSGPCPGSTRTSADAAPSASTRRP